MGIFLALVNTIGNSDLVEFLSTKEKHGGDSCLHRAVACGHKWLIRAFILAGARTILKNSKGQRAIEQSPPTQVRDIKEVIQSASKLVKRIKAKIPQDRLVLWNEVETRNYVFMCANARYKGRPNLRFVHRDASLLARILRKRGFNVSLHFDLTNDQLKVAYSAFWSFLRSRVVSPNVVLTYFSGHVVFATKLCFLPIDIAYDASYMSSLPQQMVSIDKHVQSIFEARYTKNKREEGNQNSYSIDPLCQIVLLDNYYSYREVVTKLDIASVIARKCVRMVDLPLVYIVSNKILAKLNLDNEGTMSSSAFIHNMASIVAHAYNAREIITKATKMSSLHNELKGVNTMTKLGVFGNLVDERWDRAFIV